MERRWHRKTLEELMPLCEDRFAYLAESGCDEDVAADRTFDALQAALGVYQHCCDPRDRLFEEKLRTAAERAENAKHQLG